MAPVFADGVDVVLPLDVCDIDAEAMLERRKGKAIETSAIRSFAFQLLSGLSAIHDFGIIHRDVKPSNVLLKVDGTLKIADFGMSRAAASEQCAAFVHNDAEDLRTNGGVMSPWVGSRWYRSPELLYSSRAYGFETDVWSAGVVIGDLLVGTAGGLIGRSDTDIEQIRLVHALVGSPCAASERATVLVRSSSDYGKIAFKRCIGCGVHARLVQCGVEAGVAKAAGAPLEKMLRYGGRGECRSYTACEGGWIVDSRDGRCILGMEAQRERDRSTQHAMRVSRRKGTMVKQPQS